MVWQILQILYKHKNKVYKNMCDGYFYKLPFDVKIHGRGKWGGEGISIDVQ